MSDEFEEPFCENRIPAACPEGGVAYAGITCNECTCFDIACCDVDLCCDIPGCQCARDRGLVKGAGTGCTETTCTTGSCCTPGGCEDIISGQLATEAFCGASGQFIGGIRCRGGICTAGSPPKSCSSNADCGSDGPCLCNGVECTLSSPEALQPSPCIDPCSVGTIDKSSPLTKPVDLVVDARYPHLPNNPSAKLGIGEPNGPAIDQIKIKLVDGGAPVIGADRVECWCLCETGPDPDLGPNSITCVDDKGDGVYEIHLSRPITAGKATTISYRHSSEYMSYLSNPANVNGDSFSAPVDILNLIDCLSAGGQGPYCPFGLYSCDIDHSNLCAPADILAEIDLLNGASGFQPWNGIPKPPVSPCPELAGCASGQTACGGQGIGAMATMQPVVTSPVSITDSKADNAYFADWFVKYLSTVNPQDSKAESDLRLIVDALVKWCVEHFDVEERVKLAERLDSGADQTSSAIGSELSRSAANALRR